MYSMSRVWYSFQERRRRVGSRRSRACCTTAASCRPAPTSPPCSTTPSTSRKTRRATRSRAAPSIKTWPLTRSCPSDSGVIDDRGLDTSLPPTSSSRGHHKHHASHSFTSGVTSKDVAQGKFSGVVTSKDSQGKLLMDNTPLRGSSQIPPYYSQHGSALHSQSFSNTILYDDRVRGSKDSSRSKRSDCQE